LRQREADRKAREAEAKLIIDAQLKQKAAEKLRRKQYVSLPAVVECLGLESWVIVPIREELDLARRQKEAAAIAEAKDAEAARKAAEHRAQVQAEQVRQMAEHNARLRSGDASEYVTLGAMCGGESVTRCDVGPQCGVEAEPKCPEKDGGIEDEQSSHEEENGVVTVSCIACT
jgi:hypothetical protein